jgi:iron complex outermembrane receptor protein
VGNAKLKPEESINFDVGLLYNGPVRLEAVYFRSYTDNLIQFLQTSQFTAKPQNLSKSTIQGVESSAQVNYLDHFSHTLYYTYQQAKDSSNTATKGKYLPGRPQHEMWFESSAYNKWGKIYGEYNFMSGNFLDSQNIMEITGRHILNFGITATPTKWLLINTTVKNITGNRTFDMIGFPLPGRSYWGAITLKI